MANESSNAYTKKIVLETDGGQVTLEGSAARALQRRLEGDPRYFHYTSAAGVETYYDTDSVTCGFCKVATVTSDATEAEPLTCEDGLPNCPDYVALNMHSATVKVNETVTLTADTHPQDAEVTWASSSDTNATVANGVVTGKAAGEATITASITVGDTTYTDKATITVEAAE